MAAFTSKGITTSPFVFSVGRFLSRPEPECVHSSKIREYLSQQLEPSELRWDQIKSLFDLCNPAKPVRHAETKASLKDVRIAEMAYYRVEMPQFGVG